LRKPEAIIHTHDPDQMNFHQLLGGAFKLHAHSVFSRLEPYHISPGQPRILNTLLDADGRIQKDLACDVDLKPATVGNTLSVMEKEGFIRREPDPADKRALRVYIEPAGREAFARAEASFQTTEAQCLRDFSPEEKAQLFNFLRRIHKNLKS
jgi:DNA-binding MarR family transcriptional regulator